MANIYIGADHAGVDLKTTLIEHLKKQGHTIHDLGTTPGEACDYPNTANDVCAKVLAENEAFGLLVCGTGIGMSMAANRHKGIRAALCSVEFHARACRQHNNANVLCLGERVTGSSVALSIADVFFSTEFEGGRHQRRIEIFD